MIEFSKFSSQMSGNQIIQLQQKDWPLRGRSYSWSPPTDVYKTETQFIIRIEIAGMSQAEIKIGIEKSNLVVAGSRKEHAGQRAYQQMEIRFGEFQSIIELPKGLDLEKSEANYEDGFLTIIFPFLKAIKVKIKG